MKLRESLNEQEILDTNNDTSNKKFKIILAIIISTLLLGIIILVLYFFVFRTNEEEEEKKDEYTDDKHDEPDKDKVKKIKYRLKNWEFCSSVDNPYTGEEISMGNISYEFYKAPEDAYVCTAMGGLQGNTMKYYYEKELQKVDDKQFNEDWWFRSYFTLDKNINKTTELVLLHINGINYKSDIYLDGTLVEKKEKIIGTFIKYTLDITNFIKDNLDKHYIAFKISRPYNHWGGKPYEDEIDLAISFVDWNPEAPDSNMGIWQPVDVEVISERVPTISQAYVSTRIIDDQKFNFDIIIHLINWYNTSITSSISISIGDFINIKKENITLYSNEEKKIVIENNEADNSKLWWPYQMGTPTLHKMTIKIETYGNNYTFEKKIGFKQVESELINKRRLYKINQKPILLKGAGWTPDLFLRQSPENYRNHIRYVRDMELNVIRLEGKSEGEEFYDYCDEMGILVIAGWNCGDAWQRWKKWTEEVKQLSYLSVISQIRKLSTHPSVIIFILGSDYAPPIEIEEKWRQTFKDEHWPNEILSSAAESGQSDKYQTGVKMTGPYSWVPPNYFYLEKSRNNNYGGAWGFLTEGGPGENPLRKGSYEKIFDKENQKNYESESWKYHCGNKEVFGALDNLTNPINQRYGQIQSFEDFQRKASVAVYEGHRAMFEAYSCYRYTSTGVIQWMLNNAWPGNIWHLYDYFFAPTPAYFASKKAGERFHVLYNYDDSCIYLINNYQDIPLYNINVNILLISAEDGKKIISKDIYSLASLKEDEIKKHIKINFEYDNYILYLEYSYTLSGSEKKYISTNTYLLNKEMDVMDFDKVTFYNILVTKYADLKIFENLINTQIDIEIISKDHKIDTNENKYEFKINNSGDCIALFLELKLYEKNEDNDMKIITPIFWSDNYFSILSGEYRIVTVEFVSDNTKKIELEIIGWNSETHNIINNK